MISLSTWWAISRSRSVSVRVEKKCSAPRTVSAHASAIDRSPIVTARLSFLSRVPRHSGQGAVLMYRSISSFMYSESVSRYRRSR